MIKILRENHNTILIFVIPSILILIGLAVYRDYGVSLDEEISRNNGLVSIKYICDLLFPVYADNLELIKNVPELKDYGFDKIYGPLFDILLIVIIEILLEIKDSNYTTIYSETTPYVISDQALISFEIHTLMILDNSGSFFRKRLNPSKTSL